MLLYLGPAAVRLDLAEPGESRPLAELMDRLQREESEP